MGCSYSEHIYELRKELKQKDDKISELEGKNKETEDKILELNGIINGLINNNNDQTINTLINDVNKCNKDIEELKKFNQNLKSQLEQIEENKKDIKEVKQKQENLLKNFQDKQNLNLINHFQQITQRMEVLEKQIKNIVLKQEENDKRDKEMQEQDQISIIGNNVSQITNNMNQVQLSISNNQFFFPKKAKIIILEDTPDYMNTVFQCLFYTKRLVELFFDNEIKNYCILSYEFKKLLKIVWKSNNSSYIPDNFKQNIKIIIYNYYPEYNHIRFQSKDLLYILLDKIHSELNISP